MNWKNLKQLVMTALRRAWLAMCTLGTVGFLWFWIVDGDNPLRSDDPYLVGLIFGMFAACLAIIYTATESIGRRVGWRRFQDFAYPIVLAAWCLFLWGNSLRGGEAAAVLSVACVASLIVGALTYPVCRFDVPRRLAVTVSCIAVVLLAMYCAACLIM